MATPGYLYNDNALRWRWHPDDFGNGASNENPQSLGAFFYNLRFPGQYSLSETGLNYNYFRDYDRRLVGMSRAAEAGDPKGQHALAKMLWAGLAGPRDDHAAFEWCERASRQGYLPATVMLSGFYSSGIGVKANNTRSLELLNSAVKAGSADAMSLLGVLYGEGVGVERNRKKAMNLRRAAAEMGHADAQHHLGDESSGSTRLDEAIEGVRWLRAAAKQGHPSAQYALAHLYETGRAGLPQDKQLAEHHRAAAVALEGE